MKKTSAIISIFILISTNAAAQEIRIGAIASLTGQAAEQGKNWLNGARLAEDELVKEGVHLVLKVEDDATSPGRAVSAFRKMESFDRVQTILGGTWDFLFESIVPLATSSKIPFLTMTNPVEILSKEALASEYVFTNALSLAATEASMRNFVVGTHPQTVAILAPTFPFTTAHADMAQKLCKQHGIMVLLRQDFSYDDFFQSLKVLATKVSQAKVDAVFIFVGSQGLDPFLQSLYQMKATPLILTTQHLDAAFDATSNKEAYKRAFAIYPRILDAQFSERYRTKFGSEPRVYSAEGYDALMFAARVLQKNFSLSDRSVKFEYKGVTGTYTLPVTSRQLGKIGAAVMTTRNGKFEIANEFDLQM